MGFTSIDPHRQKKLWVLAIIGLVFVVGVAVTLNNIPFIRLKSDVYLRWYATVELFKEGRNLYDANIGREVDQLVYAQDSGLGVGYYYPAHLTFLIGPLALLPYPEAHLLWTMMVQLFYLAGLGLLIWRVDWPRSVNQVTVFFVLAVLFIPSVQHTIWGQFNTIGILSLSLVYLALQRARFGWAGIWAIGLTFKPQNFVLTILFLVFWASCSRQRWRFLGGFASTVAFMWVVAAIFQPTWVQDFFVALQQYDQSIVVQSVVDRIWNPYQLVSALFVLATVLIFVRWRKAPSDSPAFLGCLSLSLAVWALVVPIVGMFHTLALIPAVILILERHQRQSPKLYGSGVIALLAVYVFGVAGFVAGLSRPEWYGFHISWSEGMYKGVLPAVMIMFALPLVVPTWQALVGVGDD